MQNPEHVREKIAYLKDHRSYLLQYAATCRQSAELAGGDVGFADRQLAAARDLTGHAVGCLATLDQWRAELRDWSPTA